MYPLRPAIQQYPWGRVGWGSTVARFSGAVTASEKEGSGASAKHHVKTDEPYAELWMGQHPNGPASVIHGSSKGNTTTPLGEFLADHPELVGPAVMGRFSKKPALPYLLKVLSVGSALSIQAHPSLERAEELHEERPDIYKDPNHKPEMAIALTTFEALIGFRKGPEIVASIRRAPELHALLGDERVNALASDPASKSALRGLFGALMNSPPVKVAHAVEDLVKRLKAGVASGADNSPRSALVLRLAVDYPGDVGVFAPYLLHHAVLAPGEAVFLGPNVPHAYLSGDCVECMAASDNVIRAGLTPKFKDVEELVAMLTYEMGVSPFVTPVSMGFSTDHGKAQLYAPPVDDFSVASVTVDADEALRVPPEPGVRILLVVRGKGAVKNGDTTLPLYPGASILIGAGMDVMLGSGAVPAKGAGGIPEDTGAADSHPLVVYIAGVNPRLYSETPPTSPRD